MATKQKWSFETAKQNVQSAFGMLDTYQECIQRELVASYPTKDAARFVEWVIGAMLDSPRRKTDGDKLKGYLSGISAFTFQTLAGVVLASKPDDKGMQRKAYDQMKGSFWKTWKPAESITLPDLGEGPVQRLAELLAVGAITEDAARMWAEQLVDQALGKIGTKSVKTKVEKYIGAGIAVRDEAGIVTIVKPKKAA
jgi:hypothetical protein